MAADSYRQRRSVRWNATTEELIRCAANSLRSPYDQAQRPRATVQLRGEFFNFMNHTQWFSISRSMGLATFGQVTTALNPPFSQLAARIVFR